MLVKNNWWIIKGKDDEGKNFVLQVSYTSERALRNYFTKKLKYQIESIEKTEVDLRLNKNIL